MLIAQSFNTISDGSAQGIFDDSHEHKIELSAVWSLDEAWSLQLVRSQRSPARMRFASAELSPRFGAGFRT